MKTIYRSRKRVTREMTGSIHTLPILYPYSLSMPGVWLEYGWSMARVCLEHAYTRRTEGQAPCAILVRTLQTESPRPTDQESAPYGLFRTLLLLFVLLVMGIGDVWGQTDFSGIWYIANETNHGDATISTHWYMVPGADPHQKHYADAYFHNQYCNTSGKGDYTGTNYGDPEKPFLTTYQTSQDLNSIWIVVSTSDGYYNIIHAKTGKYIVYEPPYQDATNRKSMHLESTTTPGDNAKFTITGSLSGPININPKNVKSGNMYFNPAVGDGNYPRYYGTGDYFHTGMIGLFSGKTDKSQWYFENASSATTLTPLISDVDETTNTITITSPAAAFSTIRYTTDGSTAPNASSGTTATSGSPINITDYWTVQAVGVFGTSVTFVTPMAGPKNIEPTPCATPIITYDNTTSEVSISCSTDGSTIHYTTDGNDPTASSTVYSGSFSVIITTTVKAIATKTESGFRDSEIASAKLVLNPMIILAETEYTYDGSAKEPAVSSLMDGETPINSDEYTVSYADNTNAGTATVKIVDKEGGDYIVYGSATFTIIPAGVTLTANSGTETYDGTEKTVTGFNCSVDGLTFEGVSAGGSGTNADEYDVTFTGVTINTTNDTSGNYVVTGTTNGTLTIYPKALTVTANPKTIIYGNAPTNAGVTYSEFAPGEDEKVLSGTLAYAYSYAQYDNVGAYTITPSGLTGANYNISFVAGTLTVGQKEVRLTWSETTSFPYDGSAHAPTASATGLVNSDAITVTVTGAQTNGGEYTATASALTGDKAGNYKLPDANSQEFSITKVGLTITANNNTITYGDAPSGNGVTYEGFVNSETESVLGGTLDYDYSYTQYGDVGNAYTITPKGLTSNNYDISFVAGTLTVNPKVVGITWENTAFAYDGEEHAPTATATGLVNSDEIVVVVSGGQTNAGNHTATASSLIGVKKGNYKLLGGIVQSFTISPKNIGEGTLAEGYTLDFGEGNTILLTDDIIGSALAIDTDYSVGEDTDPSAKYSQRRVTGQNNYTGYFNVRNVVISFTTDADQEDWSATFTTETVDESDIGLALPEGVSAFIISGIQGEWVIPEPLNYMPGGVPVLLVAHKKINGFVPTKAESGDVILITNDQKARNMLEEVTADTPGYDPVTESVPFATKQIYVLYKNEFVFNKAGNMKTGKVYLNPNHTVASPEPAPARLLIAWNHTTGIQHAQDGSMVKTQNNIWYTINGRRLSGKPSAKGLYIVGGKKIVVK